jgi:hypothetical protein
VSAIHEETLGGGVSCRMGRRMRGWATSTRLDEVTCKTCLRRIENRHSTLVARRVEKLLDARILVLREGASDEIGKAIWDLAIAVQSKRPDLVRREREKASRAA